MMDKYLKKFKVTNYEHCIIKEELIISDDEECNDVDVETVDESINESFFEASAEHNGSNETSKGQPFKGKRSGRLRNENDNARIDKQSTLDSFLKSKNLENSERLENSKNITNDEKPGATDKTAITARNLDTLYKRFTKSHCHKCNVKRTVVRGRVRCHECRTQLTYSCESCDKTYCSFTGLGYHLQNRHTGNRQIHPCLVCNKTFSFRRGLLQHRHFHHDSSEQQCAKCGEKFELKHLREHEKACDAEAPFRCDNCPFTTTLQSSLRSHMLAKHVEFKGKCENCGKIFTNPFTMKRHSQFYCNKVKRFECHHCGHKLYRKDKLLNHIDRVHFKGRLTGSGVDPSRICKYCNTTLDPYEKMKYHLLLCESAPSSSRIPPDDDEDKSVRNCEYCGLALKRFEHMNNHLGRCESAPADREKGDQPDLDTACKNLSKAYCCKCKYKRPVKPRERSCKKCKTLFKFTCERCSKSFHFQRSLLEHLQVKHVKNQTFHQCDKCNRFYSRLNNLKTHQKTHHPSDPTAKMYTCSKCKKKYDNITSLRQHRISCNKEPKYCCDKCAYKTHYTSTLLRHLRSKHAHTT